MFGKKLRKVERIEDIPTTEPQEDEGYSLEELGNAYAQAAGVSSAAISPSVATPSGTDSNEALPSEDIPLEAPEVVESDGIPVTTDTVLEAALFLGNHENHPIEVDRLIGLFRNVTVEELDECVQRLNRKYQQDNRAMVILKERGGYRMTLSTDMEVVRERFYGKVKETQLTQASIDCLAIIAYQPGSTREEIDQLWEQPSLGTLNLLVRKGLVRVEKKENKSCYFTTDRFLDVIGLDTLDDLPREEP